MGLSRLGVVLRADGRVPGRAGSDFLGRIVHVEIAEVHRFAAGRFSGYRADQFHIVGGRPSPRVRKLADIDAVVVDGAVKDMRPYLAHADVAVAPLRIARGVQNKVLEAMSMRTAVVVTREGLDGIHAKPGRQLALATDAGSFAAEVLRLLDPAESEPMAVEARQLMQQRYAWKRNLQRLQRLLDGESVEIQTGDHGIGELLATEPTVS